MGREGCYGIEPEGLRRLVDGVLLTCALISIDLPLSLYVSTDLFLSLSVSMPNYLSVRIHIYTTTKKMDKEEPRKML